MGSHTFGVREPIRIWFGLGVHTASTLEETRRVLVEDSFSTVVLPRYVDPVPRLPLLLVRKWSPCQLAAPPERMLVVQYSRRVLVSYAWYCTHKLRKARIRGKMLRESGRRKDDCAPRQPLHCRERLVPGLRNG